jgi:NTP pyrophosphatase (non-canonical NTP hydrolase)
MFSWKNEMESKFRKEFKLMIDTWGEDSQINMCIEEMGELTKALCKYRRFKDKYFGEADEEKVVSNLKNIKEEIADVLNTVVQMQYLFGEEEINKIRKEKVERTIKHLHKNER